MSCTAHIRAGSPTCIRCGSQEKVAAVIREEDIEEALLNALGDYDMAEDVFGQHVEVSTLEQGGFMTNDRGVSLTFDDGSVFLLSIGVYRRSKEWEEEEWGGGGDEEDL